MFAVSGGDCLYLVGGETPDGVVTSDVWCCDSTLNTWNQRQSMNNARSELGASSLTVPCLNWEVPIISGFN